jgi:hypothetical protein
VLADRRSQKRRHSHGYAASLIVDSGYSCSALCSVCLCYSFWLTPPRQAYQCRLSTSRFTPASSLAVQHRHTFSTSPSCLAQHSQTSGPFPLLLSSSRVHNIANTTSPMADLAPDKTLTPGSTAPSTRASTPGAATAPVEKPPDDSSKFKTFLSILRRYVAMHMRCVSAQERRCGTRSMARLTSPADS